MYGKMLLAAMAMIAAAGGSGFTYAESKADDQTDAYCATHPDHCAAIKARCAKNPQACERLKQAAQTQRGRLEERCKANPDRCAAMRERMERRLQACKDNPEACREKVRERASERRAARAACEDFQDPAERRQCVAHRMRSGQKPPEAAKQQP